MPLLNHRFVDETGQPLARMAEPLRWNLTPAATPQDDYRLRLVQADGAPPPPFLLALGHAPTIYLTASAVFTGPDVLRFLEDKLEASIPAPALESAVGVSFLRGLGVELPARIRDRVRVLPYHVTIRCELMLPEFGPEECVLDVLAEAPDGHRQSWNGFAWQQRGRNRPHA